MCAPGLAQVQGKAPATDETQNISILLASTLTVLEDLPVIFREWSFGMCPVDMKSCAHMTAILLLKNWMLFAHLSSFFIGISSILR